MCIRDSVNAVVVDVQVNGIGNAVVVMVVDVGVRVCIVHFLSVVDAIAVSVIVFEVVGAVVVVIQW